MLRSIFYSNYESHDNYPVLNPVSIKYRDLTIYWNSARVGVLKYDKYIEHLTLTN